MYSVQVKEKHPTATVFTVQVTGHGVDSQESAERHVAEKHLNLDVVPTPATAPKAE